jgi:hypothetical protein
VAIVRWDEGELHVRIELGTKNQDEARWRSRDLHFSAADERLERWRTAGLTIATLAGEVARAESELNQALETPKPDARVTGDVKRATEHEITRSEDSAPHYWADLGGLFGSGLDTGGLRAGVWANVGARLGRTPVFGLAGVDYASAEGPAPLSVQWLIFSAGLGGEVGTPGRGFLFEPAAAFRLERLHASASEGTRTDSETQFGYGAQVTARFLWQLGFVSPLVGANGWLNAEPVRILVHDQYVGTASRWGWTVVIGARLRIR